MCLLLNFFLLVFYFLCVCVCVDPVKSSKSTISILIKRSSKVRLRRVFTPPFQFRRNHAP